MATVEDELAVRAVAGDEEALVALLERFGPIVRSKLRGRIDARWQSLLSDDDVMQETYVDAFLSIAGFEPRGEGSFLRWLTTLARNNLLDAVKGLKTARAGGGNVLSRAGDDFHARLLEEFGGSVTSPSEQAARNEATLLLNQSVETLPATYQQVVRLYDLECRPMDEVAAVCECSPGAVFMRRARAHALLRERLDSHGDG
jgi:RNA polymerase sigma-70 factor, ECF subfamily